MERIRILRKHLLSFLLLSLTIIGDGWAWQLPEDWPDCIESYGGYIQMCTKQVTNKVRGDVACGVSCTDELPVSWTWNGVQERRYMCVYKGEVFAFLCKDNQWKEIRMSWDIYWSGNNTDSNRERIGWFLPEKNLALYPYKRLKYADNVYYLTPFGSQAHVLCPEGYSWNGTENKCIDNNPTPEAPVSEHESTPATPPVPEEQEICGGVKCNSANNGKYIFCAEKKEDTYVYKCQSGIWAEEDSYAYCCKNDCSKPRSTQFVNGGSWTPEIGHELWFATTSRINENAWWFESADLSKNCTICKDGTKYNKKTQKCE